MTVRLACLAVIFAAALHSAPVAAQEPPTETPPELLEQPEPGLEAVDKDAPPPVIRSDVAILRGLDKLTGAIVEFEATAGADASFERLRISIESCQMRGPEHAVFLQIFDSGRPDGLDMMFSGWMFASSPALSALDHPRYDVWLQSCKTS